MGTEPIHQRRTDDRADFFFPFKSSPSDSPSSLRSIPLLSRKNRSHISIVRRERQRRRPSSSPRTRREGSCTDNGSVSPLAAVILAHRLCGSKHLCSWTPVNVCLHVFLNTFKTFRYQHTLSPHRDTPNTFFWFCYFFSEMIQEGSKSICLTFVHNIWPLVYSAEQLINNATSTHVFPFTTRSEGTHHPACYYPAPSTTMSPFSVGSTRGKSGLLSINTMMRSNPIYCGGKKRLSKRGLHHPGPPTQLNKPHECGDNAHQSCRGYTRSV